MSRILHLTTVHPANDNRIFNKEILSLRGVGFNVLFAAPGLPEDSRRNFSLKQRSSRIQRFLFGFFEVIGAARRARADVVHFHDPELIPACLVMRLLGIQVIYDVHENVSAQVMTKHTIPVPLRWLLARCVDFSEWLAKFFFDGFVCATRDIFSKFPEGRTALVQNWPRLEEFVSTGTSSEGGETETDNVLRLVYVGGLTEIRGARQMLDAVSLANPGGPIELSILGSIHPETLEQQMREHPAWQQVRYLGWCDRATVVRELRRADIGLVLFQPAPNHLTSQPNKLFEYMAAGLPMVASNFAWWKEVIDGSGCGVTVDPASPQEIADAITKLAASSEDRKRMGEKGRRQVEELYNWSREFEKLRNLYERLNIEIEESM